MTAVVMAVFFIPIAIGTIVWCCVLLAAAKKRSDINDEIDQILADCASGGDAATNIPHCRLPIGSTCADDPAGDMLCSQRCGGCTDRHIRGR